jgi:predicted AAA+ superfamily ATPase
VPCYFDITLLFVPCYCIIRSISLPCFFIILQEGIVKREILRDLEEWKTSSRRKPLLIRGARQVGKTWVVREFSKNFASFCEVNFDSTPDVALFFKENNSPEEIVLKLSAYYGIRIIPQETLLFFDEIQSCEEAIASLRYFYEKLPSLHLIAAGSLLEFAMERIPSFGVGRIQFLFMRPLSFKEFLSACEEEALIRLVNLASWENPLEKPFYDKISKMFRIYMLIGGFPEVVDYYRRTGDLISCYEILDELMTSFIDDFSKYRKRIPSSRLEEIFISAIRQAGGKFKYTTASEQLNHLQIKEAVALLEMAGLLIRVTHSSGNGVPLGASSNPKVFKLIPLDAGLYNKMSGLNRAKLLTMEQNSLSNAGALMEVVVGTELLAYGNPREKSKMYYWHRENRSSNAEVDYLIVREYQIVPIEVKSGTKGSMQSMNLFMKERSALHGIRCSFENFGKIGNIDIIPAFAVWKFFDANDT